MQPVPDEYLYGTFFERVRRRFELCGTRRETDGTVLILKCLGCAYEINATWLKKRDNEAWCGDFGKLVKRNINSNRSHRKCKSIVEKRHEIQEEKEIERLKAENAKLREKHATLIKAIKKQKVNLKRPAMTQPRRLEVAASQSWKCANCKMLLTSSFEIDHIEPWSESFDDSRDNLRCLCCPCHAKKTADELSL